MKLSNGRSRRSGMRARRRWRGLQIREASCAEGTRKAGSKLKLLKAQSLMVGGEGGILTQSLRASCHLFSNMHEKRMNTGDFSDFYYFNSTKIFSYLVLIFALNRHHRHQGSDRAGRTLIHTL
jgi:hypothetical protein